MLRFKNVFIRTGAFLGGANADIENRQQFNKLSNNFFKFPKKRADNLLPIRQFFFSGLKRFQYDILDYNKVLKDSTDLRAHFFG